MMHIKTPGTWIFAFWALLVLNGQVLALEAIDDTALSDITGQDGLTVSLSSGNSGISASRVDTILDEGQAYEGTISLGNVALQGKSDLESTTVGDAPVNFTSTFDVGGNSSGTPVARMTLDMTSPARLTLGNMKLDPNSDRSFGTLVLEAEDASLELINEGGIFNANSTNAYLRGELNNGSLFYRQLWHQHPYIAMDNLNLFWEIPKGTLGLINAPPADANTYGILMASGDQVETPSTPLADTLINIGLSFDWQYRFPVLGNDAGAGYTEPEFIRNNPDASPLLNFAWLGALKDARLIWGPGGAWSTTNSWTDQSAAGGLRLESRWNFVSAADATTLAGPEKEFRWRFAQPGSLTQGGVGIELGDWQNLPGAEYGQNFNFILDSIPAGYGPGGGAGGLCWGGADNDSTGACSDAGNMIALTAGKVMGDRYGFTTTTDYDALAFMVRDSNLLAFSNSIRITEGDTVVRTMPWALVYTLANMDGNMFLYPGGAPGDVGGGSHNYGMVMDLALMLQSLDSSGNQSWDWSQEMWDSGTHFMIADTAACQSAGGPIDCVAGESGMGIGLIGSNLLLAMNDTRLWLKQDWGNTLYDGGIDIFSPQTRVHLKGHFGGGTIPNGASIVRGALVDVNFEGALNLRLSGAPTDCADTTPYSCYLGYSMAARLYDIGSYDPDSDVASGNGSYIALSELQRPDMAYTLGDISGDFAITNGKIALHDDDDNGGYHAMSISNDILFGETANARMINGRENTTLPGGDAAQPFMINNVALGPDTMGKVVVPSGQWGFSATLRPQTPTP